MSGPNNNQVKEEFKKKLSAISHVYIMAQEAYLYTEYFHNPNTKEELDFVVKSNQLRMIMHLMFRTMVNEVSKLFSYSQNDKYRLMGLVKSLSNDGYYGKLGMSMQYIQAWEQEFIDNKEIIDNILILRNKVYAHTDSSLIDYNEIDITFKQIKILLGLADDIIKKLYILIFDTGLDSTSPTFDKERFILLKLMVKGENQRQEELLDNAKKMIDEIHNKLQG
ncbi:MAG: hypothetical protein LBU84_08635 [Prevotella sp.]|jgi:hypothetical protein|nr:hypothetical protein [Prevotella sp.]